MKYPDLPENELERLSALYEKGLLDTPPEERFDRLTRIARQAFGVSTVLVSLIDSERQWFKSRQGLEVCETSRDISICGHAILSREIFEVPDTLQDPRFHDNPLVTGPPFIRFYAGKPLHTADGHAMGTLCLIDPRPRQLKDSERHMLNDLAACVEQEINQQTLEQVRKRVELSLAERERELLQAQHLAHIGSWRLDMLTGARTWSDEIYRVLGYAPGEIIPCAELLRAHIHPEDHARIDASIDHAEETWAHDIAYRILRPSGEVRHVHELAQGEHDDQGVLVRLCGTMQDITERVETEKALRESQERFSFAVEGAGDGVWDWDIQNDITHFSRLYMEMLGYQYHELPHHMDTWVKLLHPQDLSNAQGKFEDYFEGRAKSYSVELRLRCKDGRYKWVLCRGIIVARDAEGRPTRVIGIHSDIDVRKRAEIALIEAREEAEHANRAKSEFLSSMSHELRTPLNAIIGFGQLLEYEESLDADQQDSVAEILKAGRHLLALINEVLDLAKVESGHLNLVMEPVEVAGVVEESLGLVRRQAAQRGIQISTGDLDDAVVRADRTRLKQVLLNLLSNAIKYNREQGRVDIEVRSLSKAYLQIRVLDTGKGIPFERQAELFQPFNRLEAEGSTIEGTGIGLSIARRITELMGGHMEVESEPGVGSCFCINLPEETHQPGFEVIDTQVAPSESEARQKRLSVLYIEDNPANLKMVEKLLRGKSHIQLFTTAVPEQGIVLAREQRPALILLDIHMPGLNGFEVLEILRKDPLTRDIPVVAVSANAMPDDIRRARRAGFDDYLTKPLDVAVFLETLDTHLKANDTRHDRQG